MIEYCAAGSSVPGARGFTLRCAALVAALALSPMLRAGAAASEDAVLLSSTAPGYVPGMVINAGDRLMLPDGANATLLFRSGQMLRIRGPFEGTLNAPEGRSGETAPGLAKALQMQGVDAAVIGGTRAASAAPQRVAPDDVRIDPQRSATYCLKSGDAVWIGRPADGGGGYALRRRGNTRALRWPADASRIPWPDEVPIEDGDHFEFVVDGAPRVTATFRIMGDRPASEAAWIAEGVVRGCHDQFDAALGELGKEMVPPELWLTTDHGRAPVYRPGEPIRITVQANTDGYLYCVLAEGADEAVPVFPTGVVDGARIRGIAPVVIPGSRGSEELRAGPAGTEQIRCWLADRDISAELPHGLFVRSAERLPDRLAADLDRTFANVPGSRISKASLTLRVESRAPQDKP
ncbi:MAG: DUF4384 domain-containing protein [Acetobacteraceae bacterium]|nr:DUF4384 domain-containing protein [Acetobacteraceae bacterium]